MRELHCPHCQTTLRFDRPVEGRRVRCTRCQTTFTAQPPAKPTPTAGPGPENLAANELDPAGAPAQPARRRPRRPKASPWPIVLVAVFALGTVGLGVGAYLLLENPRLEIRDHDDGRVIASERMSADQARRAAAEARKVRVRPPADGPDQPVPLAELVAGTEGVATDPVDVEPIDPAGTVSDGLVAEPTVAGDDHLRMVGVTLVDGETPGTGELGATVRNDHPQALRQARLLIALEDPNAALFRLDPVTVRFVGPDGTAGTHLRLPWSGLPPHRVRRVHVEAREIQRDGELIVAPIATDRTQLKRQRRAVALSGFTRNPSTRAVSDPKVVCEFLRPDGMLVGTASAAPADKARRVGADEHFRFEVRLKTLIPRLVDRAQARLVGRETY